MLDQPRPRRMTWRQLVDMVDELDQRLHGLLHRGRRMTPAVREELQAIVAMTTPVLVRERRPAPISRAPGERPPPIRGRGLDRFFAVTAITRTYRLTYGHKRGARRTRQTRPCAWTPRASTAQSEIRRGSERRSLYEALPMEAQP